MREYNDKIENILIGSEDIVSLRKEIEKLENEIFDLAYNHGKHYLTFITNDISRDLENGTLDEMDYEQLKRYVENIKNEISKEM